MTSTEPAPALLRRVSRAIHEHLSRRDIMQYLDNDEDCEGLARAVLTTLQEMPGDGQSMFIDGYFTDRAFAELRAADKPAEPVGDAELIERVARAMQAVSRPEVDPDSLTPGHRGSVGVMPVWRLYEHMARAAITALQSPPPATEPVEVTQAYKWDHESSTLRHATDADGLIERASLCGGGDLEEEARGAAEWLEAIAGRLKDEYPGIADHCRIHVNALRTALEAQVAALQGERAQVWQDIATAPTDGTRILLWIEPTQIAMPFAWNNDRWMGDDFPLNMAWPTHWQPLPAPPAGHLTTPPTAEGEG